MIIERSSRATLRNNSDGRQSAADILWRDDRIRQKLALDVILLKKPPHNLLIVYICGKWLNSETEQVQLEEFCFMSYKNNLIFVRRHCQERNWNIYLGSSIKVEY